MQQTRQEHCLHFWPVLLTQYEMLFVRVIILQSNKCLQFQLHSLHSNVSKPAVILEETTMCQMAFHHIKCVITMIIIY